jgi:hypothetical protein
MRIDHASEKKLIVNKLFSVVLHHGAEIRKTTCVGVNCREECPRP